MAKDTPGIAALEKVDSRLVRAIGIPGLTANIVNSTIGAGIFVLPALVAAQLGAAAPLAFLVCALAMVLFVTCFAIAGSRVALTGGLYAYVEVAFGRYVGFLAGLLLFTTNIVSLAGVVDVLAGAVGSLLPVLQNPIARAVTILVVYAGLAFINVRGVRFGAGAVTGVTVAKLLPLLVFVGAGLVFIRADSFAWPGWPSGDQLGQAVLILLFAFFGIEVALVPSGEVKRPAYTVPRSIYLALAVTTLFYILIQITAQGTLGSALADHRTAPLAESASRFLGDFGRLLLLAGGTISAFGYVTSNILSAPRVLFAFGRDGVLPGWFAHVHSRFRSPDFAIISYAALAFVLSLTSTFGVLAVIANVAALLLYLLCSAAAWELMRRDVRADGTPFRVPGATLLPPIAIVVVLWILSHATAQEFAVTGAVVAVGSLLYFVRGLAKRDRTAL